MDVSRCKLASPLEVWHILEGKHCIWIAKETLAFPLGLLPVASARHDVSCVVYWHEDDGSGVYFDTPAEL